MKFLILAMQPLGAVLFLCGLYVLLGIGVTLVVTGVLMAGYGALHEAGRV